ncbi:hypothetical protein [Streptomyces sp. CC224B]|uniref:hypothetical protein n=1 Tax=Streptomyces sp. CC224B TaxID=3044571 RepID=UPI0024A8DFDD|nr:hypothetical protein [Streptomyces sp. CC224B]
MIPRLRLLLGPLLAVPAAAALCACGASDGLVAGEPVAPVAAQPSPEPLWPDWSGAASQAPGTDTGSKAPPPEPLDGVRVGPGGLAKVDVRELLRADPRLRPLAGRPSAAAPGRPGIRPPASADLTGDGRPERLVAIDLEGGRTALTVYAARGGRVHPVLFTVGRRLSVDLLGTDLLVRGSCAEGGEQAVRYHWDGTRMSAVSDTKRYEKRKEREKHDSGKKHDSGEKHESGGDHESGGEPGRTRGTRS